MNDEEKVTSVEQTTAVADEQAAPAEEAATPVAEPTEEVAYTPEDTVAAPPMPQVVIKERPLKKSMVISAFVLFALTLIAFAFFEFFSFTMLFLPIANGAQDFGEALALIFTFAFGIIISFGVGIVQFILNIPPIVLFAMLIKRANTKGKKALFIVFLVLSCLLLLLLFVTIALFFGATGNLG